MGGGTCNGSIVDWRCSCSSGGRYLWEPLHLPRRAHHCAGSQGCREQVAELKAQVGPLPWASLHLDVPSGGGERLALVNVRRGSGRASDHVLFLERGARTPS